MNLGCSPRMLRQLKLKPHSRRQWPELQTLLLPLLLWVSSNWHNLKIGITKLTNSCSACLEIMPHWETTQQRKVMNPLSENWSKGHWRAKSMAHWKPIQQGFGKLPLPQMIVVDFQEPMPWQISLKRHWSPNRHPWQLHSPEQRVEVPCRNGSFPKETTTSLRLLKKLGVFQAKPPWPLER